MADLIIKENFQFLYIGILYCKSYEMVEILKAGINFLKSVLSLFCEYLCVCVCGGGGAGMWRSDDNFLESVLFSTV